MERAESRSSDWGKIILFCGLFILVIFAGIDLYNVSGHGVFLGHFDKIWGAIFVAFLIFSLALLSVTALALWVPEKFIRLFSPMLKARYFLRWVNWPFALLAVAWPAWVLLYTEYGFSLSPFAIRLYIFVISVILGGIFLTGDQHKALSWSGLLQGIVLFGAVFLMALVLVPVNNYPLSITWSEGNRMWDYSVLFGRDRYIYPADQPLEAYIDRGRQSLWGLPFLLPGVTITHVRLWSAIVFTIPYAILGWILFRTSENKSKIWILAGLWVMLFLNQGPIYTPLVLSAILVALARRWPLWIGLPLIFVAGYYAQLSRWTWMFAPGIWALIMSLSDHPLELSRQKIKSWIIVSAYGLAGFLGGFGVSGWKRLNSYFSNLNAPPEVLETTGIAEIAPDISVSASNAVSDQALLWDRLWPNSTYPEGIVLGLALAIVPLVAFLIYLVITKRWRLNRWQQLGFALPILAFLIVGIIVSVKIGGGGNLHNLDMLLVALVFAAAFAWENGGQKTIVQLNRVSTLWQAVILLTIAIPAFYPMIRARPLDLPPIDEINATVDLIQSESDRVVAEGGEVLFMDQRQLLTFGIIKNIPLVSEYEKKLVMDKAMSGDLEYFANFYNDISNQRFSLIIHEPQNIHIATDADDWAEENNVWVEWVSKLLLCYYEPDYKNKKTQVWLLIPRTDTLDCPYP